jgi:hypothetical protein
MAGVGDGEAVTPEADGETDFFGSVVFFPEQEATSGITANAIATRIERRTVLLLFSGAGRSLPTPLRVGVS